MYYLLLDGGGGGGVGLFGTERFNPSEPEEFTGRGEGF